MDEFLHWCLLVRDWTFAASAAVVLTALVVEHKPHWGRLPNWAGLAFVGFLGASAGSALVGHIADLSWLVLLDTFVLYVCLRATCEQVAVWRRRLRAWQARNKDFPSP